ncbi:DEAD/DEAH box helicase family protein [Clostridium sp.]|uniref:restriction endonuclease n=1 Tax=Clostridium sp. TaxID=1506 RepID=UPI00321691A0
MAIKFNPDLDYQNGAIRSVVGIFEGQDKTYSNFTIYDPIKYPTQMTAGGGTEHNEIGVANKLVLDVDEISNNLKAVQKENHLKETKALKDGKYNFAIEMETGTGKTYVYLKTIMELHEKYGFKKYIILVPSVAIKEGVLASLKMLKSHFEYHYDGESYHDFQYSSDRLNELMGFARSDKIEIMIMTIQSFDSDNKVLNSKSQKHLEKTNGVKPIDIINRTCPIVIIDEPQTTSASEQRKKYIEKLNPLCTLQYSATHKENKDVHKVYRLTAVDAYIKKLVKEIEVASVIPKNDHNYAYVKLLDVTATKNKITAKIEIDVRDKKTSVVERKVVKVTPHDDLFDLSGEREIYSNMRVDKMTIQPNKSIEINGKIIFTEGIINNFDEDLLKRTQIRKTIEEHFEKEKRLNPKGIKVLSLFFIDKVANYRSWDKEMQIDGKFLTWFEEAYKEVAKKYIDDTDIVSIKDDVKKVHQGYFAEDNKKHFKNTKGDSADDIKAYESIMKDKEYLLNFSNSIRFIFSHSALREGWDNPNVFQICTLNENSKSNDKKRQEIGRGLRLCVKQDGERVYGFETNTLTVMANQSYEDFAKQLQTETEQDGGFKFGSIEHISFAAIEIPTDGGIINMTEQESSKLFEFCKSKGYIDYDGKTTDELKKDIRNSTVEIPEEFKKYEYEVIEYFKKVCGNLNIKDKDNTVKYRQNKRVISDNPHFIELWNRIKDKTRYSVEYDTSSLISTCANKLKELRVDGIEIEYTKSKIKQNTTGIDGKITHTEFNYVASRNRYLPDIISFLQNATNLTRGTIVEILKQSSTLYMFHINPQRYMSDVAEIINRVLIGFILSGVKYTKLEGQEFYLQEVFPDDELQGCLITELVKSDRSVYEYNRYDSSVERDFAKALQDDDRVIVYTKLPTKKFVIPTPVGEYTPDWAIVMNKDDSQKLYFVVETKGSIDEDDLRSIELLKIKFGKKRFEDVGGAGYILANKHEVFVREASKSYNTGGK